MLQRGLHRERRDENGHLIGDATDEVPQRAIWRHYRQLMCDHVWETYLGGVAGRLVNDL